MNDLKQIGLPTSFMVAMLHHIRRDQTNFWKVSTNVVWVAREQPMTGHRGVSANEEIG